MYGWETWVPSQPQVTTGSRGRRSHSYTKLGTGQACRGLAGIMVSKAWEEEEAQVGGPPSWRQWLPLQLLPLLTLWHPTSDPHPSLSWEPLWLCDILPTSAQLQVLGTSPLPKRGLQTQSPTTKEIPRWGELHFLLHTAPPTTGR